MGHYKQTISGEEMHYYNPYMSHYGSISKASSSCYYMHGIYYCGLVTCKLNLCMHTLMIRS